MESCAMHMARLPHQNWQTYVLLGLLIPAVPYFSCFWLLAIASFASTSPLLRVLLLLTVPLTSGAVTGWMAYRHQAALSLVALIAFLAPGCGFMLSLPLIQGMLQLLASAGWITIFDPSGYEIPVQPVTMRPAILVLQSSIVLGVSILLSRSMLAVGQWLAARRQPPMR